MLLQRLIRIFSLECSATLLPGVAARHSIFFAITSFVTLQCMRYDLRQNGERAAPREFAIKLTLS